MIPSRLYLRAASKSPRWKAASDGSRDVRWNRAADIAVEGLFSSSERSCAMLFRFVSNIVETAGSTSVSVRISAGFVAAQYAAVNPPYEWLQDAQGRPLVG